MRPRRPSGKTFRTARPVVATMCVARTHVGYSTALRAHWASSRTAVAAAARASSPDSGAGSSARCSLLGFSAMAQEATPEEQSHQGEHCSAQRATQLQFHELVQREVDAARARERILEWLEQQADELGSLHHGAGETQDDTSASGQQSEAVISFRNFFSHGSSIVALSNSVHTIAAAPQSAARALAASQRRSHTRR